MQRAYNAQHTFMRLAAPGNKSHCRAVTAISSWRGWLTPSHPPGDGPRPDQAHPHSRRRRRHLRRHARALQRMGHAGRARPCLQRGRVPEQRQLDGSALSPGMRPVQGAGEDGGPLQQPLPRLRDVGDARRVFRGGERRAKRELGARDRGRPRRDCRLLFLLTKPPVSRASANATATG